MKSKAPGSRKKLWALLLVGGLWLVCGVARSGQATGRRVALVMGNGAYSSQGKLKNAAADAAAIGGLLRGLGFEVEEARDQGRQGMVDAVKKFERRVQGAEIGLLFYAGHGVQVEGVNYLIPVDAQIEDESAVRWETVPLQPMVDRLQGAAKVGVIILDACRDNPFLRKMRSLKRATARGVTVVEAASGDVAILYATKDGEKAIDGVGKNSPFTEALVETLGQKGIPLQSALIEVADKVNRKTGGKQQPWSSIALRQHVYLAGVSPLCPAGSRNDGGRCLPLIEACPKGTEFVTERGCVPVLVQMPGPLPGQVPSPTPVAKLPAPLAATQWRSAMVPIFPGTFRRGAGHEVKLTRGFYLGTTEVTQEQYAAVMGGKNPSHFKGTNLPVESVSWFDAVAYCNALSQEEGLTPCYTIQGQKVSWPQGLGCTGYRLPTEAEWEFAARAGTRSQYAGGEVLDEVAWHKDNAEGKTHSVAGKRANAWGLFDMSGNVWEWVWDWHSSDTYPDESVIDPMGGPAPKKNNDYGRVVRGGSWNFDGRWLTVSDRNGSERSYRSSNLGFRLSRSFQ